MNALSIAEIRKPKGLSQRMLAKRADISFRGMQLLEQEGHNWRVKTVSQVAVAFNLPGNGVGMAVWWCEVGLKLGPFHGRQKQFNLRIPPALAT